MKKIPWYNEFRWITGKKSSDATNEWMNDSLYLQTKLELLGWLNEELKAIFHHTGQADVTLLEIWKRWNAENSKRGEKRDLKSSVTAVKDGRGFVKSLTLKTQQTQPATTHYFLITLRLCSDRLVTTAGTGPERPKEAVRALLMDVRGQDGM